MSPVCNNRSSTRALRAAGVSSLRSMPARHCPAPSATEKARRLETPSRSAAPLSLRATTTALSSAPITPPPTAITSTYRTRTGRQARQILPPQSFPSLRQVPSARCRHADRHSRPDPYKIHSFRFFVSCRSDKIPFRQQRVTPRQTPGTALPAATLLSLISLLIVRAATLPFHPTGTSTARRISRGAAKYAPPPSDTTPTAHDIFPAIRQRDPPGPSYNRR